MMFVITPHIQHVSLVYYYSRGWVGLRPILKCFMLALLMESSCKAASRSRDDHRHYGPGHHDTCKHMDCQYTVWIKL